MPAIDLHVALCPNLEQFDTKTFRYSKDVCSEKRKYLDTVLLGRFEKCYRTQMSAFMSESSKRIVQSIEVRSLGRVYPLVFECRFFCLIRFWNEKIGSIFARE